MRERQRLTLRPSTPKRVMGSDDDADRSRSRPSRVARVGPTSGRPGRGPSVPSGPKTEVKTVILATELERQPSAFRDRPKHQLVRPVVVTSRRPVVEPRLFRPFEDEFGTIVVAGHAHGTHIGRRRHVERRLERNPAGRRSIAHRVPASRRNRRRRTTPIRLRSPRAPVRSGRPCARWRTGWRAPARATRPGRSRGRSRSSLRVKHGWGRFRRSRCQFQLDGRE